MPSRRHLRAWFVTPKGRVFTVACAGALTLIMASPAGATNPPDPLTKAYGKPSAVYMKRRGRYVLLCQLWAYSRHGIPALTIERCITYGLARPNSPTATGPSS